MTFLSRIPGYLVFTVVGLAAAFAHAQSENAVPKPGFTAGDIVGASKGSRLVPEDEFKAEGEALGLVFYNRLGAQLPDPPPEKPYNGPLDNAYGAFQRGHYEQAYDLALQRAHKGDPAAETLIAELVSRGVISKARAGEPLDWYRMAADSGEPARLNRYGMALLSSKDEAEVDKGRALIKQAAEAGDAVAQFNYGNILLQQQPGKEGLQAALPWFEKSAAEAVPDAEYALSQIYPALDASSEQNRREALFWLEQAAEDEHDTAQLELALKYLNGDGVERDEVAGFDWMHRAALQGNPAAASKLALLYKDGIGTKANDLSAAIFYLRAKRVGLDEPDLEGVLEKLTPEQRVIATRRSLSITEQF